jgi:hypothetical protein
VAPTASAPTASAALPAAAASAPAFAGLVLKLGGTLAVVALGVWTWRSSAGPRPANLVREPAGPSTAVASIGVVTTPARANVAEGPQETVVAPPPAAGERKALASAGDPPALPAPAEDSYLYRLSGQILDADDLPLGGAEIFLGPRLHAMNVVAKTDEAGRFSVAFFGRRPAIDVLFTAEHGGQSLGLRELHLSSSAPFHLRAGLPAANAVFQIALDGSEAEPTIGFGAVEEARTTFTLAQGFFAASTLGGAPALQSSGDGGFLSWKLPSPCEAARLEAKVSAEMVLTDALKLGVAAGGMLPKVELHAAQGALEFASGLAASEAEIFEAAAPGVEITGLVLDAAGEPVPGAWVRCGLAGESCAMVQAEPDGSFRLADLTPGELFLRAGGGDEGLATTSLALGSGEHATWTARLDRGDEIAGRLVDPRGKPLARRLVEILGRTPAEAWSDFTFTDEQGRFAVPNCASLAYAVRVFPAETFEGFPATVAEGARPGALGDLVLDEDAATGAIDLVALDAAGEPATDVEVRVVREGSGEARLLALSKSEEGVRWRLEGLAPGAYELEAGTPTGWLDFGRVFVEAGATVELGQRFDRPGAVELVVEAPARPAPLTLAIWREHGDVLSLCGTLEASSTVVLSPGDYRVLAATGPGAATALLRIVPGMLEPLTVAIDGTGAVELRQGTSRLLLEPETEPALRATCGACHAPSETLEKREF